MIATSLCQIMILGVIPHGALLSAALESGRLLVLSWDLCVVTAMCPWTCDRHLVACTWSYDQWSHQHSLLYIVIKQRLRRYWWHNLLSRLAWWPFSPVLLWCRPSWIILGLCLSWACCIASHGFGLLPRSVNCRASALVSLARVYMWR